MNIIRFLGTSPDSCRIIPLLTSLCQQIIYNYPTETSALVPNDLLRLTDLFVSLLKRACAEKPLVIFLDSLDQLEAEKDVFLLKWIPETLPMHVKLVVSTLPNDHAIYTTLRDRIYKHTRYIELFPMEYDSACSFVRECLEKCHRKVTTTQWKKIERCLSKCSLPLYVKLILCEIVQWRSYHKLHNIMLGQNTRDSIMRLFDRMEFKHGYKLVAHSFSYITLCKNGVSESELEDLLSLDDDVLNDVYQYHIPPVHRIPSLLWTRLYNDMKEHFALREADGLIVISWYHRQFRQAIETRYLCNLNFKHDIHSRIADYFTGKWHNVLKTLDCTTSASHHHKRKLQADRKVAAQPLYYTDDQEQITFFNQRKLTELPHHLLQSNRLEELSESILFNINWIYAKLCTGSIQQLLADYDDSLSKIFSKDIKIISDALRLCNTTLSLHAEMVVPCVLASLLPYYQKNAKIRELLIACDTEGIKINALIPMNYSIQTPGGPLQYSYNGHSVAPYHLAVTSNEKYLVSVSNVLIMWDLTVGDFVRKIDPKINGVLCSLCVSPDDKWAISHTSFNLIILFNITTGEYKYIDITLTYTNECISGTTMNELYICIWSDKIRYMYTIGGKFIDRYQVERVNGHILDVAFVDDCNGVRVIHQVNSGDMLLQIESAKDIFVEYTNTDVELFCCHSAFAITRDNKTLYTCIDLSNCAVVCYTLESLMEKKWTYNRTIDCENECDILSLTLSYSGTYLAGAITKGFILWNLRNDNYINLDLPNDLRNIPTSNPLSVPATFTKRNDFFASSARKSIFIWDVKVGNLVKTFNGHYARVIRLESLITRRGLLSSSLDKSIKVWNIDNVLENNFPLVTLETPLTTITVASETELIGTMSRNSVGIWNRVSGDLNVTLSSTALLQHAVLTPDSKYLITVTQQSINMWDVSAAEVMHNIEQSGIKEIIHLSNNHLIYIIKNIGEPTYFCINMDIKTHEQIFKHKFETNQYKMCAISNNKTQIILPLDKSLQLINAHDGKLLKVVKLLYKDFVSYDAVCVMPASHRCVIVDKFNGHIIDLKRGVWLTSIDQWTGDCTKDEQFGLQALNTGELNLVNLADGSLYHTLIPQKTQGIVNFKMFFSSNDKYVIYHHITQQTIMVFRVSDFKEIGIYKTHTQINTIKVVDNPLSILIGMEDGRLVILAIVDHLSKDRIDLKLLPSRREKVQVHHRHVHHRDSTVCAGALAIATNIIAKNKSTACVLQ